MNKYILLKPMMAAVMLGVSAAAAYAIPAKKGLMTFTQGDGTTVEVQLVGDEYAHFYLTADGYPLVERDGMLCYASIAADGSVTPSALKAGDMALRSTADNDFLAKVDRSLITKALTLKAENSSLRRTPASRNAAKAPMGPGLFPDADFPVTGSPNVLVILAEYSDVTMSTTNAKDYFTRMMTERGFNDYGGTGSALDFFDESSCGQFTPVIDVYGPVKLPQTRAYYGRDSGGEGNDANPEQMIIDACSALDNEIDFSKYDNDGDGRIDNVFVFYAGQGQATGGPSTSVWPHSYNVTYSGIYQYFDGKLLDRYACSNEWAGSRPDGVGTFVHEFSHVMGLPDLYATSYTTSFTPGGWSALDYGPYNNNGCTPPLYGAFERYALGWTEPAVIDGPATIDLPSIGSNQCAIIKTGDDNEFFLLENRQRTSWDNYIPGHGMLIWHVHYRPTIWTQNIVNNTPAHQYVDIEEADGTQNEYSRGGDAFPGTANVTSFTDDTTPSMKTWAGIGLGLPITDITEAGGIISFNVDGGATISAPEVLDATDVSDDSFTANWAAVDGATEYFVTVSEITPGDKPSDFFTGFDNRTVPEGWGPEPFTFDSFSGHYATSAPGLAIARNKYLETSGYENMNSLSFWYGASNKAEGTIAVSAKKGENWTAVSSYAVSKQTGGITLKPELPEGSSAVRITYQGNAGTIYLDDISFTYGRTESSAVLGSYDGISAGNTLSMDITGLKPGTGYIYTVAATDGTFTSRKSAPMRVLTSSNSGIGTVTTDSKMTVRTDSGTLIVSGIADGTTVAVYDIAGRLAATAKGPAAIVLDKGVYIIRAGSQSTKIAIR